MRLLLFILIYALCLRGCHRLWHEAAPLFAADLRVLRFLSWKQPGEELSGVAFSLCTMHLGGHSLLVRQQSRLQEPLRDIAPKPFASPNLICAWHLTE